MAMHQRTLIEDEALIPQAILLRAQHLAVHAEMTVSLREAHRLLTITNDAQARSRALEYIRKVQRYLSGT